MHLVGVLVFLILAISQFSSFSSPLFSRPESTMILSLYAVIFSLPPLPFIRSNQLHFLSGLGRHSQSTFHLFVEKELVFLILLV